MDMRFQLPVTWVLSDAPEDGMEAASQSGRS